MTAAAPALGVAAAIVAYAAGFAVLDPFAPARAPVREVLRRAAREPSRLLGIGVRAAAGIACFAGGATLLFATVARAGVRTGLSSLPLELGAIVAAAVVDTLVGTTLRNAAALALRTACGLRRRRSARRTPPS